MTDYTAPLKDMDFVIRELSGVDRLLTFDKYAETDFDIIGQVLSEAGRFATDVWAPLNIPGDRAGCRVENRAVVVAEGFAEAYAQFVENGWQSLSAAPDYGGMGLPETVASAAFEMWQSANLSLSLCPMLTSGAIHAIEAHGSDALRQAYLPKMVTGEWTGTMVLTEPQAGSDLAAVTTKAIPEADRYRIHGTKIYITWGDHPLAENIVHLVLARLPDAPEGVRGISMFLVPKFLVNEDGSLGERNDAFPASVEHKLGIHASPTCVMTFGDGDGAIGYLVGKENRGLANMFTMMNHARLEVGVQGLAISERAYQLARAHALDRVQGRAPGVEGRATIIHHADVRRMLMLMKSQVEAMRATAYYTSALLDAGHSDTDESSRAESATRMALLTPIVKGWLTEAAQEITSLGVQVHGGMGFVEETGAAQYMRDARILPIYEGTTGIQANDFVGRKLLGDEGTAMRALLGEMRADAATLAAVDSLAALADILTRGIDDLDAAVQWLIEQAPADPHLPGAASVNLLMLAGVVVGGWQMGRAALAATTKASVDRYSAAFCQSKIATASFYLQQVMPRAHAFRLAAMSGSEPVMALPNEAF